MKTLYYVGDLKINEVLRACQDANVPGVTIKQWIPGLSVQGSGQSLDRLLTYLSWGPSWATEQGGSRKTTLELRDYFSEQAVTAN